MAIVNAIKQIAEKIKESDNILVAVNSNPSVDELSAALGITLFINDMDKHATAIFSGEVPSAIEFLDPEKTFENTVDSLRDFIIALDKEKADHLRYKVDGDMVKIFITPYRTHISEKDLDFSQGDYNVELVLAIGVRNSEDLDQALSAHGRILNDATVASISLGESTKFEGIQWTDGEASCYSDMLYRLAKELSEDKKAITEQIANAFLTGIVASTDRFSNNQTTSNVMTLAAELMASGANQQLIANKFQEDHLNEKDISNDEEKQPEAPVLDDSNKEEAAKNTDVAGSLEISHEAPHDNVGVEGAKKQLNDKKNQEAIDFVEEQLKKQEEQKQSTQKIDNPENSDSADISKDTVAVTPLQPTSVSADAIASEQQNTTKTDSIPTIVKDPREELIDETQKIAPRQQVDDNSNHTILTHSNDKYPSNTASFQAPLNAVLNQSNEESGVKDIFSTEAAPTIPVGTVQPITPDLSYNNNMPVQSSGNQVVEPNTNPQVDNGASVPPMLSMPPMPDFSSLPPMPSGLDYIPAPVPNFEQTNATSSVNAPVEQIPQQPINLPDITLSEPNLPVVNQNSMLDPSSPQAPNIPAPVDPTQFRIPGQQ